MRNVFKISQICLGAFDHFLAHIDARDMTEDSAYHSGHPTNATPNCLDAQTNRCPDFLRFTKSLMRVHRFPSASQFFLFCSQMETDGRAAIGFRLAFATLSQLTTAAWGNPPALASLPTLGGGSKLEPE